MWMLCGVYMYVSVLMKENGQDCGRQLDPNVESKLIDSQHHNWQPNPSNQGRHASSDYGLDTSNQCQTEWIGMSTRRRIERQRTHTHTTAKSMAFVWGSASAACVRGCRSLPPTTTASDSTIELNRM